MVMGRHVLFVNGHVWQSRQQQRLPPASWLLISRPETPGRSTSGEVLAVGVGDPPSDRRYLVYITATAVLRCVACLSLHVYIVIYTWLNMQTRDGRGAIRNDFVPKYLVLHEHLCTRTVPDTHLSLRTLSTRTLLLCYTLYTSNLLLTSLSSLLWLSTRQRPVLYPRH